MSYRHIEGLRVTVDDIVYMPALKSPVDKPHPYVYFLTVHNDSEEQIQILGRKWIVDEVGYDCMVMEGDGVVGVTPVLPPGEKYSYNSYHTVGHSAEVNGAFYGKCFDGSLFTVAVPEFELQVP